MKIAVSTIFVVALLAGVAYLFHSLGVMLDSIQPISV